MALLVDAYDALADLDALTAMSGLLREHRDSFSMPVISNSDEPSEIFIEDGFNPAKFADIITKQFHLQNSTREPLVKNSLQLRKTGQKGMVLNGDNSSGKSLLGQEVGLVAVMAQMGAPTPGFYRAPPLAIYAIVNTETDVGTLNGQGRFEQEVAWLGQVLKESVQQPNALIIMDEPAGGTSTIRTEATNRALIQYLSARTPFYVFVTQDTRLESTVAKFAASTSLFHLGSEYKLMEGPVKSSNAQVILDRYLPPELSRMVEAKYEALSYDPSR